MIIARLAHSFPVRTNEWALSTIMLLIGLILLNPFPTLATSPALYPLLRWGPEENWGIACLLVGMLRMIVLLINGSWRASPAWRAVFAFVGCLVWFQISLGLMASERVDQGLAIFPVFLALDMYSMFRAGLDGRKVAEAAAGHTVTL